MSTPDNPRPFFRAAFAGGQDSVESTEPQLVQIHSLRKKSDRQILWLHDSQDYVKVSLALEINTQQLEPRTVVLVSDFTLLRNPNTGHVSMQLRDWQIVGYPANFWKGYQKTPVRLTLPASGATNGASSTATTTNTASTTTTATPATNNAPSHAASSASSRAGKPTCTLEALSPFTGMNWTLQVRATQKGDVREYTRGDRTNKVFNVTFTDETAEIIATGFGQDNVERFWNQIVEGQTYNLRQLDVRPANKQFNKTGHSYELMFSQRSEIEHVADPGIALPTVHFKFARDLAALADAEVDSNVDVIGVATAIEPLQSIVSKSNIPYTKRDVQLVDDSKRTISLTLWGAEAEQFDPAPGTVVAVKGARLSSFRGLTLSATRAARVYLDPDHQRAHQLKGWYQATGGAAGVSFEKVAEDGGAPDAAGSQKMGFPRLTVAEVNEKRLGFNASSADFFALRARVSHVFTRPIAYPACTNGDCRKKVVQMGVDWRCEKCELSMPEPQYRYILTLTVSDVSSEEVGLRVSVFDEVGRQLYGDSAARLQELKEQGDAQGESRDLIAALNAVKGREYVWNIRGTMESYQGEERARFTVTSLKELDPLAESMSMLEQMGV